MNGRLSEAFDFNALFVTLGVLAVVLVLAAVLAGKRREWLVAWTRDPAVVWVLLGTAVVFAVVRNLALPGLEWLHS